MKRLSMSITVAMMLTGSAYGAHRCNAPIGFNSRGRVMRVCKRQVTDKRMRGQMSRFENCRAHAVSDSDCEWYEQAPRVRVIPMSVKRNPCYRSAGSAPVEDCYYIDGDVTRPIKGRP